MNGKECDQDERREDLPSPAEAKVPPFGLNRTAFTAAVCFDKVAKYSALGGWAATSCPVKAACCAAEEEGILG
jgi:hypothetical protein